MGDAFFVTNGFFITLGVAQLVSIIVGCSVIWGRLRVVENDVKWLKEERMKDER